MSTANSETYDGYNISGTYSTTYLDVIVTVFSNSDAVALYNYVGTDTYQNAVNSIQTVENDVVSGSLYVTVQPITVALNDGGQSYTENSQSGSSSSNNTSAKWEWPVGILIGVLIGIACAYAVFHWQLKQKEEKGRSYVKMVDFVQE